MMNIGVLGVGHLASHLLKGLILAGVEPDQIWLSPRGQARELAGEHGFSLAENNAKLVEQCSTIILAVRPQHAAAALSGLPWTENHLVISTCAGIDLAALAKNAAPAKIMRAMPVLAAEICASPTPIYPDEPRGRAVFEKLGNVIACPGEAAFDLTSVSGAIFGWVHVLVASTASWYMSKGMDAETARRLSSDIFGAAASMISQARDMPLDSLIATLATPGGITEAGRRSLDQHKVELGWHAACEAALERLAMLRTS